MRLGSSKYMEKTKQGAFSSAQKLGVATMESRSNISLISGLLLNRTFYGLLESVNGSYPETERYVYCGEEMVAFRQSYKQVHGYISLIVCIFGMLANSLNIVVLTRRDMISPTNVILTGLAFADILVMIEYIPFSLHMYILRERSNAERFTYGWAVFVLIHSHVTQVFHTISIWLTVTLAVWRYLAVARSLHNRNWCSLDRALLAILSGYVCSPILCIPSYLMFSIKERFQYDETTGAASIIYLVETSDLAKANNRLLENISFWTYSVVIKIIPCIALTILSFQLIRALMNAKKRKEKLRTRAGSADRSKISDGERQADRTTHMLLAVLLLFLITEFPQGILGLLSCILGNDFFVNCYTNLGEIMDIMALINSAINFILYCLMSQQFRQTFSRTFRPTLLDKWSSVWLTERRRSLQVTVKDRNDAVESEAIPMMTTFQRV